MDSFAVVIQYKQRQVAKEGCGNYVFHDNNLISDSEDLYLLGGRERLSFPKVKVPSYRTFTQTPFICWDPYLLNF